MSAVAAAGGPEPIEDSDYVQIDAMGTKVTAACGFGWCGPPASDEELSDHDVAVVVAVVAPVESLEPINPHHPRFKSSGTVEPRRLGLVATGGADERDYGSSGSDVDEPGPVSVSSAAAAGAPVPTVDRKPLEPVESLTAQMERMKALRASTPQYADAIMLQGSRLVELTRKGSLPRIMEIIHGSEPGELLYFHTNKMFLTACECCRPDVVRDLFNGRCTAEQQLHLARLLRDLHVAGQVHAV